MCLRVYGVCVYVGMWVWYAGVWYVVYAWVRVCCLYDTGNGLPVLPSLSLSCSAVCFAPRTQMPCRSQYSVYTTQYGAGATVSYCCLTALLCSAPCLILLILTTHITHGNVRSAAIQA